MTWRFFVEAIIISFIFAENATEFVVHRPKILRPNRRQLSRKFRRKFSYVLIIFVEKSEIQLLLYILERKRRVRHGTIDPNFRSF